MARLLRHALTRIGDEATGFVAVFLDGEGLARNGGDDGLVAVGVRNQGGIKGHDATPMMPGQRHEVGIHHLLMPGGVLEPARLNGRQVLPVTMLRLRCQLSQKGRSILRRNSIGRKRRIRRQAHEGQLRQGSGRPAMT